MNKEFSQPQQFQYKVVVIIQQYNRNYLKRNSSRHNNSRNIKVDM